MKSLTIIAAGLVLAFCVPVGAGAQTISPGKNDAYTTLTNVPVGTSFSSVAQVSLQKGKKKRMLEVDVTIIDKQNVVSAITGYVTVNGVQMHPGSSDAPRLTRCDHAGSNCTLASIFWADLDALELANPGMFKNVPLLIDVQGQVEGVATADATVSIRARMVKK